MKLSFVDNISIPMVSVLSEALSFSDDIRIAVAFVSVKGLALIEESLKLAINSAYSIEFLVGLDMNWTEPDALKVLYNLSLHNDKITCICLSSIKPYYTYHPKLYLFNKGNNVKSIIGSSNLTEGGLKKNIEANVVIEASIDNEMISDAYNTYNRLKYHKQRVLPDQEFIDIYTQLVKVTKEQNKNLKKNSKYASLNKRFLEKSKSLQKPKATKRDLVGWLNKIYNLIPDNEFTTRQIYKYESELAKLYPNNKNIRPKIRQQLQVLRDMGIINHLGHSRWIKCGHL
jgi:HKD family nuclease